MTNFFDWNVPSKWLIVFVYMQISGVNFKFGDNNFEPSFINDLILKIKKFDRRCFRTSTLFFGGV